MPIGCSPTVNLTKIPKIPLEHKFKMKQKPYPKPKHWVKVKENKTNPNWNFLHHFFLFCLLLHVVLIPTILHVCQAIIP